LVLRRFLLAFLSLCATVATSLLLRAQTPRDVTIRYVPDGVQETSWLRRLAAEQAKSMSGVTTFHNFQFTDRLAASGITFKHRIVDDAGKTYKAAHYDHGNGIAMADVDGDGLLDIYFVSQVGGNQLWKNLGGGKFLDITASAGVAVSGKIGVSASFADIDNDGDPDLYVTTVRGGNVLFENDGKGHFRDITTSAGLTYTARIDTYRSRPASSIFPGPATPPSST
jgi:enediyne biosynthesis protein E4